MPPHEEIPADLIELQTAFERANEAVSDHTAAVESAQKERYPDPGGNWDEKNAALRSKQARLRNAWPPDDLAELESLRAARLAALDAVWSHPTVMEAMATGQWGRLHRELKALAGARGWGP